MNRRNQILLGVLAVQLALTGFIWLRSSGGGPQEAGPLLPGVTETNVVRLTVENRDGNRVVLAKSGGSWVLPDLDEFPADESKVRELLEKLPQLRTDRLVAESETSHRRLKVAPDEFERKLTLQTADGKEQILWIGTTAGGRTSHVRVGDDKRVYLADDLASWQLAVAPQWMDRHALFLKRTERRSSLLEIENAQGRWTFRKSDDGTWTMEGLRSGETLDTSKVNGLASRLAALYLSAPIGKERKPKYGLDRPAARVTLTLKAKAQNEGEEEPAETRKQLLIGAKDDENNGYYVLSPDSKYPDFVVRIAAYNLREFVEHGRKDFLKQEG
ncbi:MAG: hypothetical protein KatS3mg115_2051 [Candidatus Poribacteria bacterium]|nr:MAG: hypothetical protein KatS3mg115_2051 [Candidatus Poribacteria bacterium]